METIYLGHTFVTVEDCEDAWTAGADVVASASTDKQRGTYSCKLAVAAGAAAGAVIGYEDFTATDYSAKTHVALWLKSSVAITAGDLDFLMDNTNGCGSPIEAIDIPALSANVWTRVVLAIATPASCSAIQSVGIKMVVDKGAFDLYIDDVVAFVGNDYSVLGIKGVTEPESIVYWPPITDMLLDGSSYEKIIGYKRLVTVQFGVVSTKSDRVFISTFCRNATKRIFYSNDEVEVVLQSAAGIEADWLDGVDFAKAFTLRFIEKNVRTADPPSWSV